MRQPPGKLRAAMLGQRLFVRVGVDSALHRLRDLAFDAAVFEDAHC
jgi:hypothetical protein